MPETPIKAGYVTVASPEATEEQIAPFRLLPQYVNRFHIAVSGTIVRVAFGDSTFGVNATTYHSAVAMSIEDAIQLSELLTRLVAQAKLQAEAEVAQPKS